MNVGMIEQADKHVVRCPQAAGPDRRRFGDFRQIGGRADRRRGDRVWRSTCSPHLTSEVTES
jgi:hypothetical protein